MIDVADKWDDGDMKNALVKVIANHMKKSYLSWNKDTVKDDVILSIYMNYRTASSTHEHRRVTNTTDLLRTNKNFE
jgi:hypothetical protein